MTQQETPQTTLTYTASQLAAINTIDSNLQIIACAGSGKTQVVSERVAEILRRKGPTVGPENIVAFTFTERAGAELKDRITDRVVEALGQVNGMAEMYVGTIHGYCLQLLQSHMPEYFKYRVLNEVQARLFIDRSSTKSGLSDLGLRRWVESRLFMQVLSILREGDIDRDHLVGHPAVQSLEKYSNLLDQKRYLDYTEILVRTVAALYSDLDLQASVAARVKYLIVDEYQDVNPLQEALIHRIFKLGANVCVVGDDDQTIYQWRLSNVDNILTFAERYPNVTSVTIDDNYRSSQGVVDSARSVVERNDPDRLPKNMVSSGSQKFERGDLLCLTLADPDQEATWIARKVKSMIGLPFQDRPDAEPRGLALSDFAVLLRSARNTGDPVVRALQAEGLRVVVVGMTDLFQTREAQAAVALFDFMAQRIDPPALRRAWLAADLGIETGRLDAAIVSLAKQREWDPKQRWSVYNLQRTLLGFLEELAIREDAVPGVGRGELIYYNLGKFSQVISDYEQIHFHSDPQQKYDGFANFLLHQAPNYYPEGWQDAGYAKPDAVQVMTVHQAKGMEWPVVFVPCLQANRFPAMRMGGKNAWHVIPREAVRDADRLDGSLVDERRLFYVALTRSKRWVFCSWAPDPTKRNYRRPSAFLQEFAAYSGVLTREPAREAEPRLPSKPRREMANVALSFSELKYYFECPYQFKLRFLYGFNPPIHEALGFGKSLHDALAEVHKEALAGRYLTSDDAGILMDRHLNVPFAYAELRDDLRTAGIDAIRRYLTDNAATLDKTEHVEQIVEINLGDGLVVNGRIDLIRRTDTKEIVVVDFKSNERSQEEEVTRTQLHIYALGYRELTGASADLIEIYNLDKNGTHQREEVDPALEEATREAIVRAGSSLRVNDLPRLPVWDSRCSKCDLVGVCRTRPAGA